MKHSKACSPADSGVTVIGPGRVGQALGKLLANAGISIRWVVGRRVDRARRAVRFIGQGRPLALDSLPAVDPTRVVFLTTSDSALAEVARRLAHSYSSKGWVGRVVLHTCGSLPSSVLAPLKRRGAAIGSLHPFQTVPSPVTGVRNLRGCFWAIEGDQEACRVARRFVRALEGSAFEIRPARKTHYHLAAFLVCPTVVTLMERSARLLRQAGVPKKIAGTMLVRFVAETVDNFARLGARKALTGPAVRGDWKTVERHLKVLRRSAPDLLPVYRGLLQAMIGLKKRRSQKSEG